MGPAWLTNPLDLDDLLLGGNYTYHGWEIIHSDKFFDEHIEPITGVRDAFTPFDVALVFAGGAIGKGAMEKALLRTETKTLVEEAKHVAYRGIDKEGVTRYVGQTGRVPEVRFAEHLRSAGTGKELLQYRVIDGATNLTKTQARVWEQTAINQCQLGKNGGTLLNKINSISPKFWESFGIEP